MTVFYPAIDNAVYLMRLNCKNLITDLSSYEIFHLSKKSPANERLSLTIQIRHSSRSVLVILAEVYHKRRYEKAFIAMLSDSEVECTYTKTLLNFARDCE